MLQQELICQFEEAEYYKPHLEYTLLTLSFRLVRFTKYYCFLCSNLLASTY
jgi:hypothetical protein